MPAETFIIGQRHRTRHFNIVISGEALVAIDGIVKLIKGGDIFESDAGVRKVLYIISDMRWTTLHVTNETDLKQLEKDLIIKSDAFIEHQLKADAEKLRLIVEAKSTNEDP